MKMFIAGLIEHLDEENINWRDETVIMWDGASYHQSTEMLEYMAAKQVPLMILGPYSYLIAPCELFFGLLKSTHLNPNRQSTGKK
jgi:hypothetical protein